MGLPGIGGLEASVSTELVLTNSVGTSSEFTQLHKTGQSGDFESYAGERCLLELNVTTCTVTGHGSQKMVASGHVWANYGHRVNGSYHKKTLLEKHLNQAERTFTLEFKSSTSTTSRTEYHQECKPLNPPTETTSSEPEATTTTPPIDTTPAPEPTTTPAPSSCTDAPATVTVTVTDPASTLTVYAKPTPCPVCPSLPVNAGL